MNPNLFRKYTVFTLTLFTANVKSLRKSSLQPPQKRAFFWPAFEWTKTKTNPKTISNDVKGISVLKTMASLSIVLFVIFGKQ